MSPLTLYALGSPRIERDGTPVTVSRRKALALLVYLAVTGQSQSRDTLATLLWPDQDQSRARARLRSALSILRKDLGAGWPDAEREIVRLRYRPSTTDSRSFPAILLAARLRQERKPLSHLARAAGRTGATPHPPTARRRS
jgi:DNA-binding SARP family transcriptional activator